MCVDVVVMVLLGQECALVMPQKLELATLEDVEVECAQTSTINWMYTVVGVVCKTIIVSYSNRSWMTNVL